MSEMIGRAARASCLSTCTATDCLRTNECHAVNLGSEKIARARAVIASIREPTEAMRRAYWALIGENEDGPHPNAAWRAMIDAALTTNGGAGELPDLRSL